MINIFFYNMMIIEFSTNKCLNNLFPSSFTFLANSLRSYSLIYI